MITLTGLLFAEDPPLGDRGRGDEACSDRGDLKERWTSSSPSVSVSGEGSDDVDSTDLILE